MNAPVTIQGSNFGSSQGTSTITVGGLPVTVTGWSDTAISIKIPVIATPNGQNTAAAAVVRVNGLDSNVATFTVRRGIVFGSGSKIYVMDADGSNQIRLTADASTDVEPVWSPDGTMIAFLSGSGSIDVTVMKSDGTEKRLVVSNPGDENSPSWSPDGTKIAFGSTVSGSIYSVNVDGSNLISLTNNADHGPAWSPDGARIAFYSSRTGNNEIYVMNADGSGQVKLTNNAPGFHNVLPSWSPDGARIAFWSLRSGSGEVWIMNADGANPAQITAIAAPANFQGSPSWSPDQTKIAFAAVIPGPWQDIHVIGADGSGLNSLTTDPNISHVFPSWFSGGTCPAISNVTPQNSKIGTVVTISGTKFGAVQGTSTVTFNGVAAAPTSWSDTSITVPIPAGAAPGAVVVNVSGQVSNPYYYTVWLWKDYIKSGQPVRIVFDATAGKFNDAGWLGPNDDPLGGIVGGLTYILRYEQATGKWIGTGFSEWNSDNVYTTYETTAWGNPDLYQLNLWDLGLNFNEQGEVIDFGHPWGLVGRLFTHDWTQYIQSGQPFILSFDRTYPRWDDKAGGWQGYALDPFGDFFVGITPAGNLGTFSRPYRVTQVAGAWTTEGYAESIGADFQATYGAWNGLAADPNLFQINAWNAGFRFNALGELLQWGQPDDVIGHLGI
ncbi:MAG: PD40 domain-containing protein [Armatimonadetes bacterium]|nr:PD40 domain-containing protein [Armatimonadota bacterium]